MISFRNFDENKWNLRFGIEKDSSQWQGKRILIYNIKTNSKETNSTTTDESLKFHNEIHPKYMSPGDDEKIDYWMYSDEVITNMTYHLTPEKSLLISKLSIFEDLRLAFMPVLE